MTLKEELVDILACPQCKQPVEFVQAGNTIICQKCQLRFSVRDDIPIMLLDEAEPAN